jgi:leucyl aminopeptidase
MAWEEKGKPVTPKGAAGFGVRTLFNLVNSVPNKQSLEIDKDMNY